MPLGKSDVKRAGTDVTLVSLQQDGADFDAGRRRAGEGRHQRRSRRSALPAPAGHRPCAGELQEDQPLRGRRGSWPYFSVGAEIAAQIQEKAFDWMDAPVKRVSQKDVPLPYSRELEQSALPNAEKVIAAVREVLA